MGELFLLPSHPAYPFGRESDGGDLPLEEMISPFFVTEQLSRSELHAYMVSHSVKGFKNMPKRAPFVGETTPFASPTDKETIFVIRRLSIQQVMLYRDRNSKVRYIQEDSDDNNRVVTERDYPGGSMTVDIAVLGLASWNISDLDGNTVSVNEENIFKYLTAEELDFISEKVLDVNPILSNRGNQKSKPTSDAGSTDNSSDRGDDASAVHKILPSNAGGEGTLRDSQLSPSVSTDLDGGQKTSQSHHGSYELSRT